jgi:triacylglycerol esterase/lipase EstA (alpha/beta hydrolase family)
MRTKFAAAATAVLATVGLAGAVPAGASPTYPVVSSEYQMEANEAGFILTGQDAAQSPPGVNVSCTPSAAHPYPVVLIHGLEGNEYNGFANIGPSLANAGYCVYALNYGGTGAFDGGTADIPTSAAQIDTFVQGVLAATGASKVDLLGHSEGALMAEYLPKVFPDLAGKVAKVVALAPMTHGTTLYGAYTLLSLGLRPIVAALCVACTQFEPGTGPIVTLNTGPIVQPGVAYTTIISKFDEAVTPYTNAAINEPGATNLVVQNSCPFDPVGHTGLAYNSGVLDMIYTALDPAHPVPVSCGFGPVG